MANSCNRRQGVAVLIILGLVLLLLVSATGFAATIDSLRSYGVVGNGATDDTAALQAMYTGAPDGSTVIIPSNMRIRLTATISVDGKRGIRTICQSNWPTIAFVYDGPTDQPMFKLDGSREMIFQGCFFHANGKASAGIQFMQTGKTDTITSFNRIDNVAIHSGLKGSPRPNFVALNICSSGRDTGGNCEHFYISNSAFQCNNATNSRGVVIGHGNSFSHTIIGSQFSRCAVGIDNNNGSFKAISNLFDGIPGTSIDVRSRGADPISIDFSRTENSKQFFVAAGPTGGVSISNNYFAAGVNPGAWIDAGGFSGHIFFFNNTFGGSVIPKTVFGADGQSLTSIGNQYHASQISNGAIASMDNFSEGYISLHDSGLANVFSKGDNRDCCDFDAPFFLLHGHDYWGVLHSNGKRYKLFGSDASGNQFFGDTGKPMQLMGSTTGVEALKTTGEAKGKKVVCVDTATGRLYASSTGRDCSN